MALSVLNAAPRSDWTLVTKDPEYLGLKEMEPWRIGYKDERRARREAGRAWSILNLLRAVRLCSNLFLQWRPATMKDLFDPILVEDTKKRILQLHLESAPQWGSMAVAQTLAHCTAGIGMAMGTIQTKRAPFPASLIGPMIKPLVFRDDIERGRCVP